MKEFRIVILSALCAVSFSISAMAGIDLPPAVPVDVVAVEALPLPEMKKNVDPAVNLQIKKPVIRPDIAQGDGLVVLELFSTQACSFCPKADAFMKNFMARKDMIALSCHVDYFDVSLGSFSLPICSTRQAEYEVSLAIGPKYTPQMVMNGRHDAIGYRAVEVETAIQTAHNDVVVPLTIKSIDMTKYALYLPDLSTGAYKIWLLVYQKPRKHEIQSGTNKGKVMTYFNVVSNAGFLGNWNGQAKAFSFYPKMKEGDKGFAVLVQDESNKHIIAAVKFEK